MDELEKKIEEASLRRIYEKHFKRKLDFDTFKTLNVGLTDNDFIAGAKSEEAKAFHTQGMYTEEEVKELLECYESHFRCHISQYCDPQDVQNFEEFFEQNKKK